MEHRPLLQGVGGGLGPRSVPAGCLEGDRGAPIRSWDEAYTDCRAACIHAARSPSCNPSIGVAGLPIRVGLFVTCLVDLFRPSVGFAAVKLLEEAGCPVEVPAAQTCCGQPAYNSGDRKPTPGDRPPGDRRLRGLRLRGGALAAPAPACSASIIPSSSPTIRDCAARASALAAQSHELISFLVDVLRRDRVAARFDGIVTYHDSCSGLRELGVKAQPRRLLRQRRGPDAEGVAGRRDLLRLRRHLLRQVSRDLRPHGRARRPRTSPRPAPTRCSPAISAACSTWPAS